MSGPVTLWQLCVWTYQRQRAHAYLRDKFDWFQWDWAMTGAEHDDPRPTVHHDAAMIHKAVVSLGRTAADTIVWHALTGAPPELPEQFLDPRPHPLDTDRADDYGRAEVRGRLIDYSIRVLNRLLSSRPVYKRFGRKAIKQIGVETVTIDVKYCPIVWEPDPLFVGAAVGIYRGWALAMGQLHALVPELGLREHEMIGEPPAVPPSTEDRLVFDSWAAGTGAADVPNAAVLAEEFPAYAVSLTEGGVGLHHRIARSTLQKSA